MSPLLSPAPSAVDLVEDRGWVQGRGEHYLASVTHTFTTDRSHSAITIQCRVNNMTHFVSREGELGIEAGQSLRLAPKEAQPR